MRARRGLAIVLSGAALVAIGGQRVRADEERPFACKTAGGAVPGELGKLLRERRVEVAGEGSADIRIQLVTELSVDPGRLKKYATWQARLTLENASGSADADAFSRDLLPHHGATYVNPIPWEPFFRQRLSPALDDFGFGVALRGDRPGARVEIDGTDRELPSDRPLVIGCRKQGSEVKGKITFGSFRRDLSEPAREALDVIVIELPEPSPVSIGSSSSGASSPSSGSGGGSLPYLGAGAALAALALYAYSRRRAAAPSAPAPKPLCILVLASNPADTAPIDLEKEVGAIRDLIRQGTEHERVELIPHLSVEFDDVLRTLNQLRPDIVHISGHGTAKGEIHLRDAEGLSNPVSERTLERLFTVLKDDIRVVVLNACYSERQARAIARVIDCTIGMRRAVRDDVATTFSASFYRAIASGRDVRNAFDQGCLAVAGMPRPLRPAADRDVAPPSTNDVAGPPPSAPPSSHPDEIPVLHERSGVSAANIVLVAARAPR